MFVPMLNSNRAEKQGQIALWFLPKVRCLKGICNEYSVCRARSALKHSTSAAEMFKHNSLFAFLSSPYCTSSHSILVSAQCHTSPPLVLTSLESGIERDLCSLQAPNTLSFSVVNGVLLTPFYNIQYI